MNFITFCNDVQVIHLSYQVSLIGVLTKLFKESFNLLIEYVKLITYLN